MKRIFEHNRLLFTNPVLERATIENETILHEIIDLRTNKAFNSWTSTLSSMGHKTEKAYTDTLKLFHYKEVAQPAPSRGMSN